MNERDARCLSQADCCLDKLFMECYSTKRHPICSYSVYQVSLIHITSYPHLRCKVIVITWSSCWIGLLKCCSCILDVLNSNFYLGLCFHYLKCTLPHFLKELLGKIFSVLFGFISIRFFILVKKNTGRCFCLFRNLRNLCSLAVVSLSDYQAPSGNRGEANRGSYSCSSCTTQTKTRRKPTGTSTNIYNILLWGWADLKNNNCL